MAYPRPVYVLFILGLLLTSLQGLQQIYVEKVHPVYSAGIQTFKTRVSSHNQ